MSAATAQQLPTRPAPSSRQERAARRRPWFDWMLAPAIVIVLLVILYPVVRSIWLSTTDYNLITGGAGSKQIGATNYRRIVHDPVFWQAVRNTFEFAGASIVGAGAIGLILALATENLKGPWRFVRGFLLAPWAIPVIVVAFLFQFLFLDRGGLINDLLASTGLHSTPIPWLSSSSWALWSCVIANIWAHSPFFLLVFTAGLRAVPDEVIEAARVDRTGSWVMFWRIKLPFLAGPAAVAGTISIIGNLNQFPLVYSLTGGGPGYSSTTLTVYLYRLAFVSFDIGYAGAIGVVWLVLLVLIAFLFLTRVRRAQR